MKKICDLFSSRKRQEAGMFVFLAVIFAPLFSIALVGAFGFSVWMYQIFAGPPTY